jgi:hypothetical protein
MKRRGAYATLFSPLPTITNPLPSNVKVFGIAARDSGSLAMVWDNGLAGGAHGVCVGDRLSNTTLGASAASRAMGTYQRGIDDLVPFAEFPSGGGGVFNTYPPTAVGMGYQSGARTAGAPRALDISLSSDIAVNAAMSGGAFPALGFASGDAVAYRCVIGYERLNAAGQPVEVLGAPGGRYVYARQLSGTGKNIPMLRVRLPSSLSSFITWSAASTQATLKAFMYVYRSHLLAADATKALQGVSSVAPTDEMQMVFKTQIQAGDIATGYIEFKDVCPVGGEGPPLYTSPSQGGILTERWQAPVSNTMASFKGTTFRGGISEFVARTTIQITNPPYVFTIASLTSTGTAFTFPLAGAVVPTITTGMIFSVKGTSLTADYVVSGTATLAAGTLTVPVTGAPGAGAFATVNAVAGRVQLVYGSGGYTVNYDASFNSAQTGAANKFYVPLPVDPVTGALDVQLTSYVQMIAASLCTCINFTGATGAYVPELYASNNASGTLDAASIMLELRDTNPANYSLVNFKVVVAGSTTNSFDLATRILPVQDATRTSAKNRLMWGPPGIIDCVCPLYQLDIGSPNKEILFVRATRNALYIGKEDGLWTFDGDGSGGNNWTLTAVSPDAIPITPSSVDVYEDSLLMATVNGVLLVSGASVITLSSSIAAEYRDAVNSRTRMNVFATQYGYFTCVCSYKEQTLTISIPTYAGPGVLPVNMIFVYSFVSRQWVIDAQSASVIFAGDVNVPQQTVAPLRARLSATVQMYNYAASFGVLDVLEKRIIRLPDPNGLYASALAIESGDSNLDDNPTGALSQYGSILPLEEDTCSGALTLVSGSTYTYTGPRPSPEYALAAVAAIYVGGVYVPVTASTYTTTATPALLLNVTLAEGTPGMYTGQTGWLCSPPPASLTFAPIGDGRNAYVFSQAAIMQTRRSSVKNMIFSFWLDTAPLLPFVVPDTEVVPGLVLNTAPLNVTRADIPGRMSRGSRLNMKVDFVPAIRERIEISALLMDLGQTAAEEVVY